MGVLFPLRALTDIRPLNKACKFPDYQFPLMSNGDIIPTKMVVLYFNYSVQYLAQDKWAIDRSHLNGGFYYDYSVLSDPEALITNGM